MDANDGSPSIVLLLGRIQRRNLQPNNVKEYLFRRLGFEESFCALLSPRPTMNSFSLACEILPCYVVMMDFVLLCAATHRATTTTGTNRSTVQQGCQDLYLLHLKINCVEINCVEQSQHAQEDWVHQLAL